MKISIFVCLAGALTIQGRRAAASTIIARDQLSAPDEDDDDGDEDEDDLPLEGDREGSRRPPRESHPFGIVAGLGRMAPWDTNSLGVRYAWAPNREAMFHGGTGKYRAELRRSEINYNEDFRTTSVRVGNRWYTSKSAPLFLQAGLGAVNWKGSIESKGSDSATPGAFPKMDFAARGVILDGAVGFSGHWDNGFSVEYCLLGVGQTLYSRYSYERSEDELQKVVEASFHAPVWYGLLNLSLGWFF